jgi:hypothetical protein
MTETGAGVPTEDVRKRRAERIRARPRSSDAARLPDGALSEMTMNTALVGLQRAARQVCRRVSQPVHNSGTATMRIHDKPASQVAVAGTQMMMAMRTRSDKKNGTMPLKLSVIGTSLAIELMT